MAFDVDTDAMIGASDDLRSLAPTTQVARDYLDEHVKLDGLGDSGMFVNAIGVLDEIRETTTSALAHLDGLLSASADEIVATVDLYRSTDSTTASILDRLYQLRLITQYGIRGTGS